MSNPVSGLLDWAGITDTKAGERGMKAMQKQLNTANTDLTRSTSVALNPYKQAAGWYNPLSNLNEYNQGMQDVMGRDVNSYMNPMASYATEQATNNMAGRLGSQYGSGPAQQAVAGAAMDAANQQYNQAFQQQQIDRNTTASIYNQMLQNKNRPSDIYTQGQLDLAGTQYGGAVGMAPGMGQLAGQNQSWFGPLADGVGSIAKLVGG